MFIESAKEILRKSVVRYRDEPVGTSAAVDPDPVAPNYDEVFVRDFVPPAIQFLMCGETAIVRNFLREVMRLRGQQAVLEGRRRSGGLMPACSLSPMQQMRFAAIVRPNSPDGRSARPETQSDRRRLARLRAKAEGMLL